MSRVRVLPITAMLATIAAACGHAQTPSTPPAPADTRDGRWHQDLRYLAEELPRLHGNLFYTLKRADFDAAIADLDAKIPSLCDEEIAVGIGRIVALPSDAHTHAWLGKKRLPIALYWFSDGLFVVSASANLEPLLRKRVVRIGDTDVDVALQRASLLVPNEGSASWTVRMVPELLVQADVLRGLDLSASSDKARFTLRAADGSESQVEIEPVHAGEKVAWKSALPDSLPAYRKRQNVNYWFEYWPEQRALILQYNSCDEMKDRPFADFAKELFALADEKSPAKLIVDVRYNEGGSTRVIKPFLEGLAARPALDRKERLIVLIGRRTFSSASLNALEIQLTGKATFVGEPTGGSPSSRFRESTQFELPNSKLSIGITTRFVSMDERGSSVLPDVAVATSSQDCFAGRDPAMEKALSM
jgi:hypothetical protein